jgi:hypothetical protein
MRVPVTVVPLRCSALPCRSNSRALVLALALMLLVLGTWLWSLFWYTQWATERGGIALGQSMLVAVVYQGALADRQAYVSSDAPFRVGLRSGPFFDSSRWTTLRGALDQCGVYLPAWETRRCGNLGVHVTQTTVIVPMWVPAVLTLLTLAATRLARGRSPAHDCCKRCGYNLTGNVSGRCPECGCATKSLGKEDCEVGP